MSTQETAMPDVILPKTKDVIGRQFGGRQSAFGKKKKSKSFRREKMVVKNPYFSVDGKEVVDVLSAFMALRDAPEWKAEHIKLMHFIIETEEPVVAKNYLKSLEGKRELPKAVGSRLLQKKVSKSEIVSVEKVVAKPAKVRRPGKSKAISVEKAFARLRKSDNFVTV